MKRRITFLASLLLLLLLSSFSDGGNSYTIKGTVVDEKINGKMVYLYDVNTEQEIDSTIIVDGKFTFTGVYESPTIFRIYTSSPPMKEILAGNTDPFYVAEVLCENTEITVKLADPSVVSSNGLNYEFGKFIKKCNDIGNELMNLMLSRDSLSKIYTDKAELKEYMNGVSKKTLSSLNDHIQTSLKLNKDNIFGVYCLNGFLMSNRKNMSLSKLDSLMNEVPLAKDCASTMKIYNRLKKNSIKLKRAELMLGTQFIDFSAQNVDGTSAKLSDYVGKGKYVLVDFWASWCAPCTAENPNLKYLHENYPELVVLGVNVWDKEEKFHKYIEDKDIKWSMLYASDDNTATELYGISGIPKIILFDPNGKIVDLSLRGEVMKKKIAEIYNN